MKHYAALLLLILPTLASTQPLTDSIRSVKLPAWVVNRMIHEVQLGRLCDSLRHEMEDEVALGANAMVKADSVISAQQRQIDFRDQAIAVQTDRILNQQAANQELRDEVKKQKLLTIAVGVASVLMLVIML